MSARTQNTFPGTRHTHIEPSLLRTSLLRMAEYSSQPRASEDCVTAAAVPETHVIPSAAARRAARTLALQLDGHWHCSLTVTTVRCCINLLFRCEGLHWLSAIQYASQVMLPLRGSSRAQRPSPSEHSGLRHAGDSLTCLDFTRLSPTLFTPACLPTVSRLPVCWIAELCNMGTVLACLQLRSSSLASPRPFEHTTEQHEQAKL